MEPQVLIPQLLLAFVIYGTLTQLYKINPIFTFLEHAIIGVGMAHTIVIGIDTIDKNVVRNLSTNPLLIVVFLLGFCYFCVFIPQLRSVYRGVNVMTVGATLGVGLPMYMNETWAAVTKYSAITDFNVLIVFLAFIFGSTYFLFSKSLEGVTSWPRRIGLYAVYAYIGSSIGPMWFRYVNTLIGWSIVVFHSPGIYVVALIFIGILIDVAVGWRRILGLEAKVEVAG
jgi:hypothetical protein